jgi:hypothetical protein
MPGVRGPQPAYGGQESGKAFVWLRDLSGLSCIGFFVKPLACYKRNIGALTANVGVCARRQSRSDSQSELETNSGLL